MTRTSLRARLRPWIERTEVLIAAIRDDATDAKLEEAVTQFSRRKRIYAPLALCVGAFAMLLEGLRLLVFNWRLMLVQVVPALWVWLAMYDLKAHVLHGKTFHSLYGAALIPIVLVIVAITIASFLLNAVFAFAIAGERPPNIRAAFERARANPRPAVIAGVIVGLALAFATTVAPRWGKPWFTLTLGIVVGVMMLSYVAVPARIIGVKKSASPRDKLATSLLSGALSATVCTPPYLLGRLGILMLGSSATLVPGIILLALGLTLQAGATGAVRAIKLGASLTVVGAPPAPDTADV